MAQNDDVTGSRKSIRDIFSRFAQKTAMQGVGYIDSGGSWYSKAVWIILLVVAIGWMLFHLWYLFVQYLKFSVQTQVYIGSANLQFPAITLCNMNAVKLSKLSDTPRGLQEFVNRTDPKQFTPTDLYGKRRRKRFVKDLEEIDFDNYTTYGIGDIDNVSQRSALFNIEKTFRDLYFTMPRNRRIDVGHRIDDMLLSCSFNGYKCFSGNFTRVSTREYGNCYTIQSDDYIVTEGSPTAGLTLVLFTEKFEYIEGISQGYGLRLHIHKQGSYPMPDSEGIFIPASYETHVALRLKEIIRQSPPYTYCNDGIQFQKTYGLKYSRRLCHVLCEQTAMINECGCYSYLKQEYFAVSDNTISETWCKNQSDNQCISEIQQEFKTRKRTCNCLDPCTETKYSFTSSGRQWPTPAFANVLIQSLCEKFPTRCSMLTLDTQLQSMNFLKVTIYFEDIFFERYEEEPEIEFAQFMSDVGGAIGLWIGLSVLAIFEVVQFFIELCSYGVNWCTNRARG